MTRTFTGLCAVAAVGMVASLGAQTTGQTSTTDQSRRSQMSDRSNKNEEVSVTGCLQKGEDGKYILTNARVDNSMGAMDSHGTMGTTSGTTGSTAGTTTGTTTGST